MEHVNRMMKVSGGIVGITLNPSAHTCFFLTAPELAWLSDEAKELAGQESTAWKHHHELSPTILAREENNIKQLRNTIHSCTNPFLYEGEELINTVTKTVMPDNVVHDMSNWDDIGHKEYIKFVEECVSEGKFNIWSRMQKIKIHTWKAAQKVVKHKLASQFIELKEDCSLFAHMLVVARSQPEIDLKDVIQAYEFSSLP